MKLNLVLILVIFSCAQVPTKRDIANLQSDHQQSLFRLLELSRGHLLDYLPEADVQYPAKEWAARPKKSYELLGHIDRNLHPRIPSLISGHSEKVKPYFLLKKAKQIPYDEWLEMSEAVSRAYLSGHHVFRYRHKIYSVWGIELTEKNISPDTLAQYQTLAGDHHTAHFLTQFFNRYRYIDLPNGRYGEFPSLKFVGRRFKRKFINDLKKQEEELTNILELIHYSNRRTQFTLKDYENYFGDKYDAHRKGEVFKSADTPCSLKVIVPGLTNSKKALKYLQTLINHKANLMEDLQLTNNVYNELAALAMGVLLVESKMGRSFKYFLKEGVRLGRFNFSQKAISLAKRLKGRSDENSRGLTQIKDVGPYLEDTRYEYLNTADLNRPENAALATMFVLREKYGYLQHFKSRHPHINDFNWSDYLYYFYQGSSREITKGTATPKLNLRIQKILDLKDEMIMLQKCE